MTELSAGILYEPLTFASPTWVEDASDYMWPSYKRTTLAKGGDAVASWSMSGSEAWLEKWLDFLGYDFRETYAGYITFKGLVWSLRLTYNGVVVQTTLANVYNRIASYYTSAFSGQSFLTGWYDDTASQDRWGIREFILRPSEYMTQAQAEQAAQDLLVELAQPRVSRGRARFDPNRSQPVLKVEIRGYCQSLDDRVYTNAGTGTDDVSALITDALTGANFVVAGDIVTNTTQANQESKERPALQRVRHLANLRDANGDEFVWGCFGDESFIYKIADRSEIHYDLQMKSEIPIHTVRETGDYVPAPLVEPGRLSFTTDIMSGRNIPATNLEADPRIQFDVQVEYSEHGAVLRGRDWSANERSQAIEMAIQAQRLRA